MSKNKSTDINFVKQQNQKAEAKKQQASGIFANGNQPNFSSVEFGSETDFSQVKQQNQQAEAKKQKASGIFAKSNQNNNNN